MSPLSLHWTLTEAATDSHGYKIIAGWRLLVQQEELQVEILHSMFKNKCFVVVSIQGNLLLCSLMQVQFLFCKFDNLILRLKVGVLSWAVFSGSVSLISVSKLVFCSFSFDIKLSGAGCKVTISFSVSSSGGQILQLSQLSLFSIISAWKFHFKPL